MTETDGVSEQCIMGNHLKHKIVQNPIIRSLAITHVHTLSVGGQNYPDKDRRSWDKLKSDASGIRSDAFRTDIKVPGMGADRNRGLAMRSAGDGHGKVPKKRRGRGDVAGAEDGQA